MLKVIRTCGLVTAMVAFSLLLVPAGGAVAQAPVGFQADLPTSVRLGLPTIGGHLRQDVVIGTWFAPNTQVAVTIGGFTGSVATDRDGSFGINREQHGEDLVPGMVITADDGTVSKQLTLVAITIDIIDQEGDTVAGTAPPNSSVGVGLEEPGGGRSFQEVTADGSGDWTADFAGEYDVGPLTQVDASVPDADGDTSEVSEESPTIDGDLAYESVSGNGFADGGSVNVTIDGFSGAFPVDSDGQFFVDGGEQGLDLAPGTEISVSDGAVTKNLILVAVTIDSVHQASDTIAGTAPPNRQVDVEVSPPSGWSSALTVTADGSGSWTADFGGLYDVDALTYASASVRDGDGDTTSISDEPATFDVDITSDYLSANGFEPNGTATVEIYDQQGGTLLTSRTQDMSPRGEFDLGNLEVDVAAGMFVTVADGTLTKELTLVPITIDTVDRTDDTVSGTAPVGAEVVVGIQPAAVTVTVTADGAGAWTADFGAIGANIGTGTDVEAAVRDEDGDGTRAFRRAPRVNGNLTWDYIEGEGFAPDSSVTVTVGPFSESFLTGPGGDFWVDSSQHGQDLVPGTVISVSDGDVTKELTLAGLSVDTIDPAADTVSGTAPPDSEVWVDVYGPFGDGSQRVTAGGGGDWAADFSGAFDIGFSTSAQASLSDEDNDGTTADGFVPTIEGNLTSDWIRGIGFAPNASVDVTAGSFTGSATTDGAGGFQLEPGLDLVAGAQVTVTDGSLTHQLTLAALTIDAVDLSADTVSGTAPGGAEVTVTVSNPDWGELVVTAGPGGTWTADFSGVADLTALTDASAVVADADGDRTRSDEAGALCYLDGTTLVVSGVREPVVRRSGNQIQVLDENGMADPGCAGASVNNVDRIVRNSSPGEGTGPVTIDLSGGQFAPGATMEGASSEIEFELMDTQLVIVGRASADVITLGAGGVNLNGDADADVTGMFSVTGVDGGAGNDTISAAGGSGTGPAYEQGLQLLGGLGRDVLTGGLGDDDLEGGLGNDVLSGRAGNNTLEGDDGTDAIVYEWSTGGVTVTLSTGVASGGDFSDTLASVEDVTGSAYADQILGSLAANSVDARGGPDNIDLRDGIMGNDSAIGGVGVDICLADPRDRMRSCEG